MNHKSIQPNGRTDVVAQQAKLYIEGVQVPFINMSISQIHRMRPTAFISIPPYPGMMDIGKFYEPKVHIFYKDPDSGADILLFAGTICATSYSKNTESGSVSIDFQCKHRYENVESITLDYTGYSTPVNWSLTDVNEQGENTASGYVVKMLQFSSDLSIMTSMRGVENNDDDSLQVTPENVVENKTHKVEVIPAYLRKDYAYLKGFPGIAVNMWNQIKEAIYGVGSAASGIGADLYIPLIEDGLQLFQRTSGHQYIEKMLDEDKKDACPKKETGGTNKPVLVPPCARTFMKSALQTALSMKLIRQAIAYTGESTNLWQLMDSAYASFEYELQVLASPVVLHRGDAAKQKTIDLMIKPQIPYYYSPSCNVILPNLITSINVSQADSTIPTRVTVSYKAQGQTDSKLDLHFRAPPSIREAIARAHIEHPQSAGDVSISTTLGMSLGAVGKYEYGRGVKQVRIAMPMWMEYLKNSLNAGSDISPDSEADKAAVELLANAWNDRYGEKNAKLNPWIHHGRDDQQAHFRNMFAAADYTYTKMITGSRQGSCDGPFNPYIIPGYPMDILDPSPMTPSFHAFCTSVTHTITASSMNTSISFVGAITYSEMANYYMLYVHPWLQTSLKVTAKVGDGYVSSIVANPVAKAIAKEFYSSLGVDAWGPEDLMDFNTGRPKCPVPKGATRKAGASSNGGTIDQFQTVSGNLSMVWRDIENKQDIEKAFGLKFIDMVPENYNDKVIQYTNPNFLATTKPLEPGASPFLMYT